MGTQGLVSILKDGRVKAKISVGCSGDQAKYMAMEIVKRLRDVDALLLEFLAEHVKFGCTACRVCVIRDEEGILIKHFTTEDIGEHHAEPPSGKKYQDLFLTKFGNPFFNPRWASGISDYCYIVDLDKFTIQQGSWKKGVGKFLTPAQTVQ